MFRESICFKVENVSFKSVDNIIRSTETSMVAWDNETEINYINIVNQLEYNIGINFEFWFST